jgi:hypothetical protein
MEHIEFLIYQHLTDAHGKRPRYREDRSGNRIEIPK